MHTTLFQPCDEANTGVGTEPKPECQQCEGRGFYYFIDWARTCICKARST